MSVSNQKRVDIIQKYMSDIRKSFIQVCVNEGYSINEQQLNDNDILDEILSGSISNMGVVLNDSINNQLLGEIPGLTLIDDE